MSVSSRPTRWSALGAYRTLLTTARPSEQVLRPLDEAGPSAPMLLETLETFLDLAGDVISDEDKARVAQEGKLEVAEYEALVARGEA